MPTSARTSTSRSRKTAANAARPRSGPSGARRGAPAERALVSAETLAGKQREISVSEFFAKNRHLLGFDNPRKALLTTVKEAVDNALDACEEAGILPEIHVELEHLPKLGEGRYRITIQDNGPGIVRKQVDNIFGKLLYGSKFHRLKMSRGQQGIGISAAGMYGLMTTGKPMVITTRSKKGRPAHHVELAMDTTKNMPEVTVDIETEDFPEHTGTRVSIELEGKYTRGRTSVDEYLEQTAIANPHAQITYKSPATAGDTGDDDDAELLQTKAVASDGAEAAPANGEAKPTNLTRTTRLGEVIVFPRTVHKLPPEPCEIKPHPRGVELGSLMRMLKQSEHKSLGSFLQNEFCRVSPSVMAQICEAAGRAPGSRVEGLGHAHVESIYKAIQQVKIQSPPLDCLAPIGTKQILAGLLKGVRAEFYTASTRPPSVYRGNPFQIEVGIAFGGELPGDQPARVIRFANRVPLLYQQSACSSFKAVLETTWRNYGLSQGRGAAPEAPLVVMIHMASVWVPFTSESKEAIADYDEIRKEMRLALQECGRKLATYVRRRQRIRREGQRRDIFERYIGEVVRSINTIRPDIDPSKLKADLELVARRRTELADETGAEDGLGPFAAPEVSRGLDRDEDTVIIESEIPAAEIEAPAPEPAAPKSKKGDKAASGNRKTKRRASPSGDEEEQESLF